MNNKRQWHILNAKTLPLGRLSSHASKLLMGKNKPGFVRYADNGDYVVITNAKKIKVTGKKLQQKIYTSYSGYPSGLKKTTMEKAKAKNPKFIIEHAIKGMLPKNRLRRGMFNRLKVFATEEHPYADKISNQQS